MTVSWVSLRASASSTVSFFLPCLDALSLRIRSPRAHTKTTTPKTISLLVSIIQELYQESVK